MLVAAGGDEARVVGGDGEGEDGVAVGVVGLDQAGFGDCGVGFLGVVEVDGAVGGAGEELGGRAWLVEGLVSEEGWVRMYILACSGGPLHTVHRAPMAGKYGFLTVGEEHYIFDGGKWRWCVPISN